VTRFDYGPAGNERPGGKRPAPYRGGRGTKRIDKGTGHKGEIGYGKCPECRTWGKLELIIVKGGKRLIKCNECTWRHTMPGTDHGKLFPIPPWVCVKCELPLVKVIKGRLGDYGTKVWHFCPEHGYKATGKKQRSG
jgi:hypothetical protein